MAHLAYTDVQGNGTFHVYARCSMPRWAVREAGAPEEVWLDIRSDADSDVLNYDVIWVNKTATRLPEVSALAVLIPRWRLLKAVLYKSFNV